MDRRGRGSAGVSVAVFALVLAVLGLGAANAPGWAYQELPRTAAVDTRDATPRPLPTPPEPTPSGLTAEAAKHLKPLPGPVTVALAVLAVAAVIAVAVFVYRVLWARTTRPEGRHRVRDVEVGEVGVFSDDALSAELAAGAQDSLQELRSGELDASGAIIAAWQRFAATAQAHGIVRTPATTSTEFTQAVLARGQVSAEAAGELAALYRRAMFDAWVPDAAAAEQAGACLERIVAELDGGSTEPSR